MVIFPMLFFSVQQPTSFPQTAPGHHSAGQRSPPSSHTVTGINLPVQVVEKALMENSETSRIAHHARRSVKLADQRYILPLAGERAYKAEFLSLSRSLGERKTPARRGAQFSSGPKNSDREKGTSKKRTIFLLCTGI